VTEHKLVGRNYTTPDLVAKVTGRAKYAEDYRADGMLFCKLLLSPFPHARVKRIDASAALAMPGVKAILTADDLPGPAVGASLGEGVLATAQGERALANEPVYQGEPVLAVAAVDELTAAEAIERIHVDFEPLPFVVDPIETLRPGSPNARLQGNVWVRFASPRPESGGGFTPPQIQVLKWTDEDFSTAPDGQLPMGRATDRWEFGDLEAGFGAADLVIERTFVTPNTSHQPLETRSAMAYWQNGKLYLHGSTQSTVQTIESVARWLDIAPDRVVVISEYTGGGFGSKIPGAISMVIPALLSKKANAPVMMRVSREEEHYIGRARAGLHARVKLGMRRDGRITAIDMFVVCDNGPYDPQGDGRSAGLITSVAYQPEAMRWRGLTVLTNTPPRTSQRAPGGAQAIGIMEPIVSEAARRLGLDQLAVRRINAPAGKAPVGPPLRDGRQPHVTSAFVREALDRGAELFRWNEKKTASGRRRGSRVRGIGVAVSPYAGGSTGFDGLFVIRPDGRMYLQSGIGNHGSHSVIDVHRVAAELLCVPWEKCVVTWGNTAKHLPWTCQSSGSQTTHAMTRAAHAAAMDAIGKLRRIAALDLGGKPEDYAVGNERVFREHDPAIGMSLAKAAGRAIELGGIYDGHDLPDDINTLTKTSASALAGQGLMGVGKDTYPHDGQTMSYVVGFAEVEVDVETGKFEILEYTAVADVGTVMHPRSLGGQILGGGMLGIGHAISQKWVYDQHYGVALAKRFHHNRPPSILDAPRTMKWDALDIPDPETPVGARGVGEPPVGAAYGAVMNAVADALGDQVFRRSPVTADLVLMAIESGRPMHEPLTANI
jgi:xanthine dehydrogenase molybdenum-binding subunit